MNDDDRPLIEIRGCGYVFWLVLLLLFGLFLGMYVMPRLGPAIPAPQPSTLDQRKEVVQ